MSNSKLFSRGFSLYFDVLGVMKPDVYFELRYPLPPLCTSIWLGDDGYTQDQRRVEQVVIDVHPRFDSANEDDWHLGHKKWRYLNPLDPKERYLWSARPEGISLLVSELALAFLEMERVHIGAEVETFYEGLRQAAINDSGRRGINEPMINAVNEPRGRFVPKRKASPSASGAEETRTEGSMRDTSEIKAEKQ